MEGEPEGAGQPHGRGGQSASTLENISVSIYRPATDARLAQKEPGTQCGAPLPS